MGSERTGPDKDILLCLDIIEKMSASLRHNLDDPAYANARLKDIKTLAHWGARMFREKLRDGDA